MVDVRIKKLDDVKVQVICEPHILKEIEDCFKFRPPGYQFSPSYKNRYWDGWIRMLNARTGFISYGLWSHVKKECESRGYSVNVDKKILVEDSFPDTSGYDLAELFEAKYKPRDYQNAAVVHALNKKRGLLLSPTASGKSFVIYLITRYLVEELNKKVLIIVPTVSLTKQMKGDFIDYNNGSDIGIHEVSAGASKQSNLPVIISTWQSLQRVSRDYLDQYDAVIVDEAHTAKAASITKLLEKMPSCEWRFGFTGTIQDDGPVNQLTLEGLFGPIYEVTKTHKLIEDKTLADFSIKAIVFEHEKMPLPKNYEDEIDFLVSNEKRNKYIVNLAEGLEGNTLILFNFVERHGDVLAKLLKDSSKNFYYIHGGIKAEEREKIRKDLEKSNNNILLASFGTTSTGTNIVNLDNVIFAHPTKSKIRNLQSIGRILRKNGDKEATLYDLVDDLRSGRLVSNYSLKHFEERTKQYESERFKLKHYYIKLR